MYTKSHTIYTVHRIYKNNNNTFLCKFIAHAEWCCHLLRLATVRETQQVALDNELLEVLPQLYINREDQLSMQLECRGKGGQPCQGPAHMTVKVNTCVSFVCIQSFQGVTHILKSKAKHFDRCSIGHKPQPPHANVCSSVHFRTS